MTYCVAMRLNRGLVFAADTRTSAGSDNVASFRKLYFWRKPGQRVLVLCSAGNLAITQSVISLLNEQLMSDPAPVAETLFTVPSLYRAARVIGDTLRQVRRTDGAELEAGGAAFNANFLFGGQIGDELPRLFHIYPEGNFIEATDDTPFFQIGEHKYGKPIIDRVVEPHMGLGEAAKLALLSFDSTLRSNLSVGLPIDLLIYECDSLDVRRQRRIEVDDEYFRKLSAAWSEALRQAFANIEEFKV
ncbi:MAG TPA: proteasome-type protease [Hyphomicrobiaceae bacterium]|nr:proteasome-type protease [Hyphomicrobiaceae bacterium]